MTVGNKSTFRQVSVQAGPGLRSARDMINAIFYVQATGCQTDRR